jgi:hypothetical protein
MLMNSILDAAAAKKQQGKVKGDEDGVPRAREAIPAKCKAFSTLAVAAEFYCYEHLDGDWLPVQGTRLVFPAAQCG